MMFLRTALLLIAASGAALAQDLSPKERLGELLFEDTALAQPGKQACVSCHGESAGWTGPDSAINAAGAVMPGAIRNFSGSRKPPSIAYVFLSPEFDRTIPRGGQFWDGRAANPVAQALLPFLNRVEQHNLDRKQVTLAVRKATYAKLFESVWKISLKTASVDAIFLRVARSIAAYEASADVNPFSSRFDDYFRKLKAGGLTLGGDATGLGVLTAAEIRGLSTFLVKCNNCHRADNGAVTITVEGPGGPGKADEFTTFDTDDLPPVFSDFRYRSDLVPRNPQNPIYTQVTNLDGFKFRDEGIGPLLGQTTLMGKFKTPMLRNVDKRPSLKFVKAYMHNGTFKSLKQIVTFYNTRDQQIALGLLVPETAFPENGSKSIGAMGLSGADEDDLVAFLRTLSDR